MIDRFKTTAAPIALTSALLLAAFAATPINAAQPTAEREQKPVHESEAEVQAFEAVKTPLSGAISIAETHSGGKALDVSFENRHGKPAYRVKTLQNNQVWEGLVDANSGQIIGRGKSTHESKLDREDKAELAGLRTAKTTLAQATATAERQSGGKAIDAGLEETRGKVAYEVEIVKDRRVRTLTVDPGNGQVAQR
jgi:uncharacterized membrane protein YkoI